MSDVPTENETTQTNVTSVELSYIDKALEFIRNLSSENKSFFGEKCSWNGNVVVNKNPTECTVTGVVIREDILKSQFLSGKVSVTLCKDFKIISFSIEDIDKTDYET